MTKKKKKELQETGSDTTDPQKKKRPSVPTVFWLGLALGAFTLLLRWFFQDQPHLIEKYYSRALFPLWRWAVDYTLGWLPFPVIYPIILGLILWLVSHAVKTRRQNLPRPPWWRRLLTSLLAFLGWIGIVLCFFYAFWGFNYFRVPIQSHLNIAIQPLGEEEIHAESDIAHRAVISSRRLTGLNDRDTVATHHLPSDLETQIRTALVETLTEIGYPAPGRVRVKKIWPGGILMRFATSGFYLGFEGYVADRLTATEIPFTMAHEMAHGYGFAEEGTANFLAYITCLKATDPLIRYSGCLSYWNYIGRDLYRADQESFRNKISEFGEGIRADLRARYENWQKYAGWLMRVAEKIGDVYLKSQGQEQGIKSYNRVVMLVAAWRDKIAKLSQDSHVLQSDRKTERTGAKSR